MKKVISILIAVMMMSTTVLANTADALGETLMRNSKLSSFTSKTVLSAKLNEPLEMLEDIPKAEDMDVDYSLLVSDLINSKATVECAYNASEDYKKIQMSISMAYDVPIHINDGLKFDAYAKSGVWYNYDVTDEENPRFEIISKSPVNPYYEYGNLFDEYGMELTSSINPTSIKDAINGIVTALKDNAEIKKSSMGYTMNLDNEAFSGFISDCIELINSYATDADFKEFLKNEITPMDFDFLGKDGITLTLTENSKGSITAYAEKVHFDFNLYDLLTSLGVSTDGLSKEKSQIDIAFETVTELSGHNKTTVELPELTAENSREMFGYYYDSSYYESDKQPVFKDNIIYYPIDEVIRLTEADVVIDGNRVIFGDVVFECDRTQLITFENEPYVTEDVLGFIGVYYTDVSYNTGREKFEFTFYYENPDEVEEEPYDDYTEEYVSPYLHKGFDINRAPHIDKGIFFMPVYEFVCELGEGEFGYGYKSLKYTATTENSDGIKTLSVKDGDNFVVVNGENIEIEAPAVEVDGVLNIPVSFVMTYGYSADINSTFSIGTEKYTNTTYSFMKENPLYDEEEYEWPYLSVYIQSDQLPHIENGEVYVPLYDFLYGMYEGEFSFTENGMVYVATSENEYGITKVSVTIGDNFVTVNDEKVEFENAVVRINDIIRVPLEFTKALGFETDWISVYDDSTSYSFSMLNPKNAE